MDITKEALQDVTGNWHVKFSADTSFKKYESIGSREFYRLLKKEFKKEFGYNPSGVSVSGVSCQVDGHHGFTVVNNFS